MVRIAVAAVLALAGGLALAGEVPPRLDVPLGKTVEVDVGYATGWMCDDPSLVQAAVVTRHERNVWRVTGAKLGTTTCRVGTDPFREHHVFSVRVARPAGRPAR